MAIINTSKSFDKRIESNSKYTEVIIAGLITLQELKDLSKRLKVWVPRIAKVCKQIV